MLGIELLVIREYAGLGNIDCMVAIDVKGHVERSSPARFCFECHEDFVYPGQLHSRVQDRPFRWIGN